MSYTSLYDPPVHTHSREAQTVTMAALADKEEIFNAYEDVRKDDSETNW